MAGSFGLRLRLRLRKRLR